MAAPLATAALGSWALASYLDAKLHLRHDLQGLFYGRNQRNKQKYLANKVKQDRVLLYHVLEDHATDPVLAGHTSLIFPADGRTWTYKQFYEDVNRVGNWLHFELGVKKGELVALDGLNSPEYLILWFAIDSVGACACFVNHNLTNKPLEHCLKLAEAKYCLADADIKHLVEPVAPHVEGCTIIYYTPQFLSSLPYPVAAPPRECRSNIALNSMRVLMYTSGTTGLPKGVIKATSHEAYSGYAGAQYLGMKPSTRFYTCLPVFHGTGRTLGVAAALNAGCTLILGRKFSHATFWPDVVKHKADIIQYVGELCRYLLSAPPSPLDRQHNVKMAWGNGMRPDVWEDFRQRFNIPIINEFYAATDGLGKCENANRGEFSRAAIDVRGLLWNLTEGQKEKIVKIDADTQDIIRDPKSGFAIKCARGEAGETIHQVDPKAPLAQFSGYHNNREATNKRFIRDVFEKGDMWFRSGDMMRQDTTGCVYFVDRLGDTYRWKSENVSTAEVADLLGTFNQISECNVYGVLVPHADGRAGCAAIVLKENVTEENFDFSGLAQHALSHMPRFAVPVFLRLTAAISYTGTMKMQKSKLREEGCDVEKAQAAGDKLYWLPPNGTAYEPFTSDVYVRMKRGEVRL